ncbi:MAG: L-2-hydroxyglutarate oxidase [Phycisphaerae bacterium]|nr:L-2-hydroxyglutarate oxidase [Phycisphaerae bacterium]NIR66652.1 L-2-hydroxyglutarate oxidase [candidate division Zixibacteria bacterium]NIP50613.1 L-2-hydroxyglutarate oxidase [Phycisphaerae bacterium]NIS49749.1 L-2-hydroxyglutarate oxidase [Phycisphaerae bacterium]NIU07501.1 L-2-hydroxyglutarate oxidase [Phycisphaerae bacterium]
MMKHNVDFDIVVIGGGIVGLASAYKIARNHPGVSIAVLEKEQQLATHQTGHNSGVIHSGLYYTPGSNKAKTCARGRKELVAFAREHRIKYEICGKIIVATREKELANLELVYNNGLENEIEGIEKIGPDEIKTIEPSCQGIAGIRVSCTGIIDFTEVANKLAKLIVAKGKNQILDSHEVLVCDTHDYFTNVVTNQGTLAARYIINCAGLHCDRVAKMCGIDAKMRIVPFRGDYYELTEQAKDKVKNLIYPVPDPKLPFLGVHFTRMIDGSVECGPNAVFSFKREGYGKLDFSLKDSWGALSYVGTWKMFLKHFKYGLGEYARAFSRKLFLRSLQRLIPSLVADDIKPCKAGVRAQAVGLDGEPIDDFWIEKRKGSIHVLNAPSPAATASLAIGDYINKIATEHFKLSD